MWHKDYDRAPQAWYHKTASGGDSVVNTISPWFSPYLPVWKRGQCASSVTKHKLKPQCNTQQLNSKYNCMFYLLFPTVSIVSSLVFNLFICETQQELWKLWHISVPCVLIRGDWLTSTGLIRVHSHCWWHHKYIQSTEGIISKMTPNCGECWLYWRAGLPFRDYLIKWSKSPREISWGSTKTKPQSWI